MVPPRGLLPRHIPSKSTFANFKLHHNMPPQRNILHIKTLPCSLPCPGHPSTDKREMTSLADLHKGKTNRAKGSKSNKSRKLPSRFLDLKRDLIRGNESAILDSWSRLLQKITPERLSSRDWRMIPEVHFSDIQANNGALPEDTKRALKERGTIIVRGLVSQS